jgi:hypothetical protein
MFYLAHQRHKPQECPGNTPKHLREMSEMLSPGNLSRMGLKFIDAYIDHACVVQASGPDHVCSFLLEGDSDQAVSDVFKPFPVEVKSIVSWAKFVGGTA